MKLVELFESDSSDKKPSVPVDQIAMLLFRQKAGKVTDPKRKGEEFIGVSHGISVFKINDKPVRLTFDNSTSSGEFEINSLVPFQIERGSDKDELIKKYYKKKKIDSKKRFGYIVKDDTSYLREIHLGKELTADTVKFVADLVKIINHEPRETEEE